MKAEQRKLELKLNEAVETGTVGEVQAVIKEGGHQGVVLNLKSALESASRRGDVTIFRALLDAGGDVEGCSVWKMEDSPLQIATLRGHEELFDFLMERGADVNRKANYQATALHFAVRNGLEWVKKLVEAGADMFAEAYHYTTPFDESTGRESNIEDETHEYLLGVYQEKILECHDDKSLVIHRVLQDITNRTYYSERHRCNQDYRPPGNNIIKLRLGNVTVRQMSSMIDFFLSRQPDALQAKSKHGELPIHSAFRLHYEDPMIRLLLRRVPDYIGERDGRNRLPIHIACYEAYFHPTIQHLLELKPTSLFAQDVYGRLPIHSACCCVNMHTIRLLVERHDGHRALSVQDRNGDLPIHVACLGPYNYMELLRYLVDHDPTMLREENNSGELPLHCACRAGLSLEAVQFLSEQHPDSVQSQDDSGNLPLHVACRFARAPLDAIRFLVERHGAALNTVNRFGDVPLHCACRPEQNQKGPADYEYEYDSDNDKEDSDQDDEEEEERQQERRQARFEIIHCLAERGGSDTLLLENGNEGALPLHLLCALRPPLALVQRMVESAPESVSARNQDGFSPLELACQTASLDVIYFLFREHVADFTRSVANVDPEVECLSVASGNGNDLVTIIRLGKSGKPSPPCCWPFSRRNIPTGRQQHY